MIREIRKYTSGLAEEFNEVVKDFEKDTAGERSTWKEIGEGLAGATKSVTDTVRAARIDAQGTGQSVVAPGGPAASLPSKPTDVTLPDTPVRWMDIPSPSVSAKTGTPVLTSASARFCPECGGQAAGGRFCSDCGTALTGVAQR